MTRLPCIICENGDVYSNIVCDNCEAAVELRKETYESMIALVMDLNKLNGYLPYELLKEIHDKVKPIYDLLCEIKVKDTRNIL